MNRRAWHLLAIGALAGALPARAADLPGAPPPAPPLPIAVPAMHETTLDNGLRLIVAPRRGLPLVTLTLVMRAGSEADPADRAGLAAMTTTLMTRGARRGGRDVDAATLAREAESLGGALDAGTGWRSSSVGMTVGTPQLAAAMALVADVVRHPLLPADEFGRERERQLDGLRVAMDSPGSVAAMASSRAWWGASPYGAVPTPASLGRLDVADLRQFHATHWRPDRAALVLAGDVDLAAARALAASAFGDWARPAQPAPASPAGVPAAPAVPPVLWIDMPGSGQSAVLVSAPAQPLGEQASPVAEVAHALLGGGYSSRLNQAVRIERGLSYGAFGSTEAQPAGGRWTGQAQTRHATAAEVARLTQEVALRLAREEAPADELAARQAAVVGAFARRLQTTAGLAGLVAMQVALGRDPGGLARHVARVRAVTPAQVRDYAAAWWKPGSFRVVIAGDWQAAGESVKALDAPGGVLRLPVQALDLDRPTLSAAGAAPPAPARRTP